VNPWRLQAWLGHKRIDKTMLYVHVAEAEIEVRAGDSNLAETTHDLQ
jgi:site-specific recombinase XerD